MLVFILDIMEYFKFKKKYGQNFLKNTKILENIVNSIDLKGNDLIVEIGPGDGALTKELKQLNVKILAYEIDSDLISKLDELKDDNCSFIIDDFLKRDIISDLKAYSYDNLVLVANLPYYITTPILDKVMNLDIFKEVIVMVQDEVAKRLCSDNGSKDYSAFTVLLDYFYDRNYLCFVDRESFYPIPSVDSAVIKLVQKEKRLNVDYAKLRKFLFDSFQFKRKNLRNNLKHYDLKKIESILIKYNLNLNSRAEQLNLEIFVEIVNSL